MNLKGRNLLKKYHGPGIWEDMDGALHFALPDILQHLGLPVTAENERFLARQIEHAIRQQKGAAAQVVHRAKPEKQFGEG
jgi:hypothetical protein